MCSKLLILTLCLGASVAQNSQTNNEHRSKREAPRPVEFQVDGEKVQLNLKPAEHDALPYWTPVWTVEYSVIAPYHIFKKLNETEHKLHETSLYQDSEKMATVLAFYKGSELFYDGVFGESKLAKAVRSNPEQSWSTPDYSNKYHIVYNVENTNGTTQPLSGYKFMDLQRMSAIFGLSSLNPKILVIIENSYFIKKFRRNVPKIMRYLSAFWNSVNLQFSKITHPKVKLTITGVIIAKDDRALSYITNARKTPDSRKIDYEKLINGSISYFKNEFNKYVDYTDYDLTMTIVKEVLNPGKLKGTVSSHYCSDEGSSGFIWDDGSYGGVLHALRNLGSSLGMPYDDAGKCDISSETNSRSIMATTICPVEKYYWSEESQMGLFLYSMDEMATCLRDEV